MKNAAASIAVPSILRRLVTVFVWVLSMLAVIPVQAQQQANDNCNPETMTCPEQSPAAQAGVPALEAPAIGKQDQETMFAFLDTPDALVRSGIRDFARSVDAFFANEKLTYENTGSYIRVTADDAWYARENSGFSTNIRARLKLPRTSEKYKLLIENSPDQQRDDLNSDVQDTPLQTTDTQKYFAGIQAVGGNPERWRYRSGIGIRLGAPVETYLRLGSWREFIFDHSGLRFEETIYRYSHDGMRYLTTVEYNRELLIDLLFRSTTQADWTEVNHYFDTRQVFSFYRPLAADRQLVMRAAVYGVTEPVNMATDYLLSVGLRRYLRKRYLYVEFIPQIHYQKVHQFAAEYGVILRLEWVFQD